jgi:predicted transcriptional regulator
VLTHLRAIREALRLSVADLASIFGVSRPTIYAWQSGGRCTELNALRIRSIASEIEPRLDLFRAQSGRIAHRAVEGSSTVLDLLRGGVEPRLVFNKLATIIEREDAQRNRLSRRLQATNKLRGKLDVDSLG